MFVVAKNAGIRSERPGVAKGSKVMAVAHGNGLPFAINIAHASPHEVTLAEETATCVL